MLKFDTGHMKPETADGAKKKRFTVLILGNYRQTLSAVRSLKRVGYRVILGYSRNDPPHTLRSCAVDELWEHHPFDETAAFLDDLKLFLSCHPGTLVFPLGDLNSELLAKHHSEFAGVRFCMPEPHLVLHCLDKRRMTQTAADAGLPVPRTASAGSLEELRAILKEIELPWAVKPGDSLGPGLQRKAFFVETADDLETLFPVWPPGITKLLVQQKIKGLRYNVDFAARSGEVVGMCHAKILRVDTWDYTGVAVDTVSMPFHPAISKYTKALIRALDYTGIGLMQFLHHPDEDDFYFLELNPRLGAVAAGPCHAGFDVPLFAAALTGNSSLVDLPKAPRIRIGRRCNWMTGDLTGLLHFLNHRQISTRQALSWLTSLIASFLAADCHCTFEFSDPAPTLGAFSALLVSAVRHIHQPLGRRALPSLQKDKDTAGPAMH
jgi:predicted ATP-grasp superfamily ATP-dependent carboligase